MHLNAAEGQFVRTVESRHFSQGWQFHSGDTPWWQPTGEKFDAVLDRWREVALPHSFNAEDTFTPARGFYRGVAWYRKTFTLTDETAGRKVFLEFGAAFSLADVWVNERHAGQFMGGYTGFTVDATDLVRPGENLIAVKVDNAHDPDILPGIAANDMDYALYGGLYREAALVIKDRLHIPQHGIAVTTPFVSAEKATLRVAVGVANDFETDLECECRAVVRAPFGETAAEMSGRTVIPGRGRATVILDTAEVIEPMLWSIEQPHLYTLEVEFRKDGVVVDDESVTIGLRWFEFTADRGFLLNGRPVKLRGLNRHQDYPGLGNGVPRRLQVRDAELLKEMGANFVRLSHYPQHPAFLDACDRLGLLVYEEIASWQYIGGEMFARNAEYMMREMIARDRNHPCVILWGLLNEGRSRPLFERLHRVAKACDPTRPTVYADNNPREGMQRGTVYVPDVLGINYELQHLDEFRAALPGLKFLSSETTNYEHRRRGDVAQDIGQVERFRDETDIVEQRDYMAGMALWSLHDYGTDYELSWPIQNSGVFDAYRLPKGGYWFLRSRWSAEPVVRIIGHWTWPGLEGQAIPVLVCTNAESVELYLNGRSLGVYPGKFLARWDVPYVPGTLRAVARTGERAVEHALNTAGDPAALAICSSSDTLAPDGADAAEITITVVDKNGEPVPTENGHAVFRVEGPATLRGIAGIPCTPVLGGIGRIVVQAQGEPGTVMVRAAYRGLPEAAVMLKMV
jgi:beta-galactosidase